jgi:hypothetical protein
MALQEARTVADFARMGSQDTDGSRTQATPSRPATRFALRAPVIWGSNGQEGTGEVQNISSSGMLIERSSVFAKPGWRVWVRTSYFPGSTEVPIPSVVVRTTETGFAVRYAEPSSAVQDVIGHILPA